MAESENNKATQDDSNQAGPVFREKSLGHVMALKHSRAYLKGSGPTIWLAGIAIAIIIVAVIVWSSLASPQYLLNVLMSGAID